MQNATVYQTHLCVCLEMGEIWDESLGGRVVFVCLGFFSSSFSFSLVSFNVRFEGKVDEMRMFFRLLCNRCIAAVPFWMSTFSVVWR